MFGKVMVGGCVLVFAGVFGMGTRLTSGLAGATGDSVTVAAPISQVYAAVDDVSLTSELGSGVNMGSHGTVQFSQTREVGKSYTIHATRGSETLADIKVSFEAQGDSKTEVSVDVTRHQLAGGEELPLLFRGKGLLEAAAEKQIAGKLRELDPEAAERMGLAYARNQSMFQLQLAGAMGRDPAGTSSELSDMSRMASGDPDDQASYRDPYRSQASASVSAGRPMLNPEGTDPTGTDPTPREPSRY